MHREGQPIVVDLGESVRERRHLGEVRAWSQAVHDAVLHELGHELFAVTVAGDDLERTKPFPDPYLHAAAAIHAGDFFFT